MRLKLSVSNTESHLDRVAQYPAGDEKVKTQDRAMHELAAMIAMSASFPNLRAKVIDFVVAKRILLRPAVFEHFRDACAIVHDLYTWMQLRTFNDNLVVGKVGYIPSTKVPEKIGPSRAELEKKKLQIVPTVSLPASKGQQRRKAAARQKQEGQEISPHKYIRSTLQAAPNRRPLSLYIEQVLLLFGDG